MASPVQVLVPTTSAPQCPPLTHLPPLSASSLPSQKSPPMRPDPLASHLAPRPTAMIPLQCHQSRPFWHPDPPDGPQTPGDTSSVEQLPSCLPCSIPDLGASESCASHAHPFTGVLQGHSPSPAHSLGSIPPRPTFPSPLCPPLCIPATANPHLPTLVQVGASHQTLSLPPHPPCYLPSLLIPLEHRESNFLPSTPPWGSGLPISVPNQAGTSRSASSHRKQPASLPSPWWTRTLTDASAPTRARSCVSVSKSMCTLPPSKWAQTLRGSPPHSLVPA